MSYICFKKNTHTHLYLMKAIGLDTVSQSFATERLVNILQLMVECADFAHHPQGLHSQYLQFPLFRVGCVHKTNFNYKANI